MIFDFYMEYPQLFKHVHLVSNKTGIPVYVVGGFVRDLLLYGRELKTKDVDFVVVGSGVAFARAFDEHMKQAGSLVEFEQFDTARYVFSNAGDENEEDIEPKKKFEIEFAGARKEQYDVHSRKPQVQTATLDEDLSRRDFTINAMALPVEVLAEAELSDAIVLTHVVDPFDGKLDLHNKILKTPLDPDETFSEDPLRMLRAARFAAQLGFAIEPACYEAIERNCDRLNIISAERIQEEFFKLLAAPMPSIGLRILCDTKLMYEFLPEIMALSGVEEVKGYTHKDNLSHTFAVVDNIAEYSNNVLLRYAGLMHDVAKPDTKEFVPGRGWTFDMHEHLGRKMARVIGSRLRMKKKDVEYVAKLVRWHLQPIALMDKGVTDSAVRRLIVNAGNELSDLMILCRSDVTTGNQLKKVKRLKNYDVLEKRIAEVIEKDKLREFQSPVRGEEIMELCGLKPGPTVGKIKKALEEAILDGKIPNDYEAARQYFDEIKDDYLNQVQDWEKAP